MHRFILLLMPLLWLTLTKTLGQSADSTSLLPVDKMQRDINILQASLTSLHPGLYRYNTPDQIQQAFDQLRAQASRPQFIQTFYKRLAQFTTKLHCGHTYPNPFNLNEPLRQQIFSDQLIPVYFRICENQWIITHNVSAANQLRPGDQITAINAIPVEQIRDSLLTVSRSDGRQNQAKKIDNLHLTPLAGSTYALFDQYFRLFFPNAQSSFTLTIQPYQGKAFTAIVPALSKVERQRRFEQQYGKLPTKQATWQYRPLNGQTAYVKIGDLAVWGWSFDARRYLDSVFTLINQGRYARLIVDIRGCEGGDDDVRNELLSYLMPQPFGCNNPTRRLYRYLTVADSLLPYLQTWDASFKQPKSPQEYVKTTLDLYEKQPAQSADCQPILPKANRFPGQLTLLIDAANSSTTFTLADWIQQANTGELAGEPTGGTKQGLNGGQFFFLHLPNSHIEIDIPLIYQAPTKARPDEGVQPNRVIAVRRQDIIAQKDGVLRQVLDQTLSVKK